MDLADQALELVELNTKQAISKRKPELPFIGACHYCREPLLEGRYCDIDCGKDHETELRFKNGI